MMNLEFLGIMVDPAFVVHITIVCVGVTLNFLFLAEQLHFTLKGPSAVCCIMGQDENGR